VTIARGALVSGALVLPGEKSTASTGLKLSGRAKIAVDNDGAVKGGQRLASSFKLPNSENTKSPAGTDTLTLQSPDETALDFTRVRNLTVKHPKREVVVPPGTYGDFSVVSGRIVLGVAGSITPTRYYFQSLSLGTQGAIDLAGQAIVIVNTLGSIHGQLGNRQFVNWLDLRVVGGTVDFQPASEVFGVVTATGSVVTLGRGAKLRGGLICDRATVEDTGLFTGVKPDWSRESSGNSLPHFIHKAARLEKRLPDMAGALSASHTFTITYPDDVPLLTVNEIERPVDRLEQHTERRAFFQACCALFDGTGFSEGRINLMRASRDSKRSTLPLDVLMERHVFENHLRVVGGATDARENIRRIRDDPLLLNLFMERSLKVASALGMNR
jgi:hypothetical protein